MDEEKYSTLVDVFQDILDPRKARGKRYGWLFLLALIASAVVSGEQTAHAIAQWVTLPHSARTASRRDRAVSHYVSHLRTMVSRPEQDSVPSEQNSLT